MKVTPCHLVAFSTDPRVNTHRPCSATVPQPDQLTFEEHPNTGRVRLSDFYAMAVRGGRDFRELLDVSPWSSWAPV